MLLQNNGTYSWEIRENFMFIYDMNDGGKSVTNDIENIIPTIVSQLEGNIHDYFILTYDTEGNWDGVKVENGQFVDFILLGQQKDLNTAMDLLRAHVSKES